MVLLAEAASEQRGDMVTRGERLFSERGCTRCHTRGVVGTPIAVDVARMAEKYTEEQLVQWLRDPQAVKPSAHMPKIELTDAEMQAIGAFIAKQR